jgi:Grx4 family monothiol glutaredoxin
LTEKHGVETAPTVLIFHPHKTDVEKLVNPSPETLNEEIEKQNEYYRSVLNSERERVFKEIKLILASAPLVVFIKGTPTEPKCKFTRRLLAHFTNLELTFKSFNILEDERIRQWLKVYSNWQTYPQIYINKEFVGGIDVLDQLIEDGEFMDMVPKECKKLPPVEVFEEMLSSFDVVVLIEGLPDKTTSESSKSILETLDKNSIKYVTVDFTVLGEEVKKHIQEKYAVDSCPYIFLKRKSFGNEETLQKHINDGNLEDVIPEGSRKASLNDRLKKLISKELDI